MFDLTYAGAFVILNTSSCGEMHDLLEAVRYDAATVNMRIK